MLYRKLGNTSFNVSEIGYGGEHLEGKSYEIVDAVINAALDGGINIMDVFMPQPEVRSNMGRAIGSRRKDVYLQGHIGAAMVDGQYKRTRDPKLCDTYIKDFLMRFNTDYIDIGMLHFVDTQEDFDKAFNSPYIEYALSLKQSGIIHTLGVSSHNAVTAIKMVETGLIDVLMFSVNPAFDMSPAETALDDIFKAGKLTKLELDPTRARLYELCAAKGVGVTSMKTLGAGRLLNAETSNFGTALTAAQCISYALDRPSVASVLLGAQTVSEVETALAYENTTARERDYTIITEGGLPALGGKCMYCNHCLPCVQGIDIASVTKYLDMARVSDAATVRSHYDVLASHGGDCIECGSCETACPFHVSVRDNMRAAAELFGK